VATSALLVLARVLFNADFTVIKGVPDPLPLVRRWEAKRALDSIAFCCGLRVSPPRRAEHNLAKAIMRPKPAPSKFYSAHS